MIEREFIKQKTKEYYIKQHIKTTLRAAEVSEVVLKKIPLGEKIVVTANRPSVVVGSKGSNIRALTRQLKTHFGLENPQVEIAEVVSQDLDANIVAARIASSLERFGSARFKGIGHKTLSNVMNAGALGVEIKISGKIPGARAKSWRFYLGYLKKCGDVAVSGVRTAYASARLKSGIIGIQVRIMPGDLVLPDHVEIVPDLVEEVSSEDVASEKKKPTKKKTASKKTATKAKKEAPAAKAEVKTEAAVEVKVEAQSSELAKESSEEAKGESQ